VTAINEVRRTSVGLVLHAQHIFAKSFDFLVTSRLPTCAYFAYTVWHCTGQHCSSIYACMYRLFAGMWHPVISIITTLLCCDYFSSLSVVLLAFSVLCIYSKFGHHLHVPNFVSFTASIAQLEKLHTQSLTQLI